MSRRLDKPLAVLSPTSAGKKAATVGPVSSSSDRGNRGAATVEQTGQRVFSPNHLPPTSPSSVVTSIPKSPFSSSPPPTSNAPTGAMDQIKKKLAALKDEADHASDRAEAAEAKVKKYEQEILVKDQEIQSLQHRLGLLESDLDKAEATAKALKHAEDDSAAGRSTSEALSRKIALLEEELDAAEKHQKDSVEKLRQVDVKAEHFERQVQRLEQERDQWEKKFEEMEAKYKKSQAELDDLVRSMSDI